MTMEFLGNSSCIWAQFFKKSWKKIWSKLSWKFSMILIRILVASLIIQQFKWLVSSSRIKRPWNSLKFCQDLIWILQEIFINIPIRKLDDYRIIVKFIHDLIRIFSRIRWPQNSCIILQVFLSEFRWLLSSLRIRWPWNSCEILPVFDQNSSRKL